MDFISEQDYKDILFGCEMGVDFIAASFTRRKEDVLAIRKILEENNSDIGIIAKIENSEGVSNLTDILEVADGIMVARGDLGVEIPLYDVPVIQRKMIKAALRVNKPVIVATQMLDSMQYKPLPTRAEVSDVANAILSGADAIMLSGETASGEYPVEAVTTMSDIALRIEQELDHPKFFNRALESQKKSISSSIGLSCVDICNQLDITAIVIPTLGGSVARQISNFRPVAPIIAVTHDLKVMRKLNLYSCIQPIYLEKKYESTEEIIEASVKLAKDTFNLAKKDLVIVTCCSPLNTGAERIHANMLKIETIK